MTPCRLHRVRYERLWRLPSVRTMATITMATITLAIIAASRATVPLAIAVLTIGMLGALVTLRRHRDRVALELRMLQALVQSRHRCPRGGTIPGLTADVGAEAMPDGVTRIEAESWLDAIRALGFAVGRDRGFQLERLRRVATGRLSQVWGRAALPLDTGYRSLGLAGAAKRALDALEEDERDLLEAFATGVNAAWDCGGPPFECRFLAYDPQPWTPTDSLVIALLLFHGLSWNEQLRRAEAVIRHVFPEPVARFFLPDGAGEDPGLPERLEAFRATAPAADVVLVDPVVTGSNCWIGSGPEGPVLACDLHVPLSIPNALYEVDLRWPEGHVRGLISPGLPVVLTGTNGRLAWGITNLSADVLDLGPTDGDGSATVTDRELIRVRGHPDVVLEVARAGAIPVSARLLLGRQVALRWTGFDARSCDLKLQRLAQASSVDESIAILDGAHGVALNVLFADESGRMAHLATGLLPRRGPGEVSPDRADGYVTGPERPRVVDPADGLLVSANDAALPERTRRITYDPDPGHRARRVRQLLMEAQDRVPATMRAMQHDTRAEAYLAYRHLALAAVRRRGGDDRVAAVLAAWDGNAAVDSVAFGLLVRLRETLARRVLAPYLTACLDHDPDFRYAFQAVDRPVLALVTSDDPSLLPRGEEQRGWDGFIAHCVEEVVRELRGTTAGRKLPTWGELNRVGLRHPLTTLAPWAGPLLGIVARPQPGALHCVRTCVPGLSAVARAVLTPGARGSAHFDMPAGQSGHPLSRHYNDRHPTWLSSSPRSAPRRSKGCHFVLQAPDGA